MFKNQNSVPFTQILCFICTKLAVCLIAMARAAAGINCINKVLVQD